MEGLQAQAKRLLSILKSGRAFTRRKRKKKVGTEPIFIRSVPKKGHHEAPVEKIALTNSVNKSEFAHFQILGTFLVKFQKR